MWPGVGECEGTVKSRLVAKQIDIKETYTNSWSSKLRLREEKYEIYKVKITRSYEVQSRSELIKYAHYAQRELQFRHTIVRRTQKNSNPKIEYSFSMASWKHLSKHTAMNLFSHKVTFSKPVVECGNHKGPCGILELTRRYKDLCPFKDTEVRIRPPWRYDEIIWRHRKTNKTTPSHHYYITLSKQITV